MDRSMKQPIQNPSRSASYTSPHEYIAPRLWQLAVASSRGGGGRSRACCCPRPCRRCRTVWGCTRC